jgi:hypothetical protein
MTTCRVWCDRRCIRPLSPVQPDLMRYLDLYLYLYLYWLGCHSRYHSRIECSSAETRIGMLLYADRHSMTSLDTVSG